MSRRAVLLALILACMVPAVANADNAIKPGAMLLYCTYAAVGIDVPYSDDDNHNATARFVWKKQGEDNWRNGVEMTIDRKHKRIWASIWPLEQGETIEVEISFVDPDLTAIIVQKGKAIVRKFTLEPKDGRTFHVSPAGDDANPGSKDKPFKTLAHAAKEVKGGDIVYASTGVYAEGDLFKGLKGTASQPIVFAAAPGEKPVLDSSHVIAKGSRAWKPAGGGVFVTTVDMNADGSGYVAQDGQRMFPYPSLADLKSDKAKVKRAWFYDKKTKQLFVRTGTANEPDGHLYNVSRHTYGVHLTRAQHVVIRGFTMRFYGAVAVRLSEGADSCVLYENIIHNCAGGIFMKSDTTRDNAIWKNEIYEVGASDFSWNAHYSIEYGNQAIYATKCGPGNSFCHNRIHGYFDLIAVESWKNPDNLTFNRDCDIMFNELFNASDDAIEVDGGGVNMRIHANRIRNCLTAISLAPIERGPVYVTRNHATFLGLFFKFNVGGCTSHGWTYIYHNSGYALITGPDGGTGISFPPTIPCSNKVLKNNIIVLNEWCVRAGKKGYELDYNCYFNVPGRPPRRFQWEKKVYGTIADFAKATGQETHGLYADPRFVSNTGAGKYLGKDLNARLADYVVVQDAKDGDLRLQAGSPCIDRGVVIRGVSDDFDGKAPDIGAFEHKR